MTTANQKRTEPHRHRDADDTPLRDVEASLPVRNMGGIAGKRCRILPAGGLGVSPDSLVLPPRMGDRGG